ncbi:hypothetical protein [Chamaesiphon sp.]|uniref:hypothetical protein n=1 Tax=Chamaesiphon sp. TaxID=2814140 RepID=UPI0035948CD0
MIWVAKPSPAETLRVTESLRLALTAKPTYRESLSPQTLYKANWSDDKGERGAGAAAHHPDFRQLLFNTYLYLATLKGK